MNSRSEFLYFFRIKTLCVHANFLSNSNFCLDDFIYVSKSKLYYLFPVIKTILEAGPITQSKRTTMCLA